MTSNHRIALNVIATYCRSLYALVAGLFCGRWALTALGEIDYGLMGVVGGLTVFLSFFNDMLAVAVGRFYAYSIGVASRDENDDQGLSDCRQWFTTACLLHIIIPLILIIVGYPLGEWAVTNYLTIPSDRLVDSIWVFRFACIGCFVSMVSVPYQAMYIAKQSIAELTIYSFATTTLNFLFLYYMVTHPGSWLVRYSLWGVLLVIVPKIILSVRAPFIFKECRFVKHSIRGFSKIKQILAYTGWNFASSLGGLMRGQGIAVLVNKYFGPRINASMSLAGTVNSHAATLTGSVLTAFSPAITTAYGAGNFEVMKKLVFRTCKFAVLTSLVFMLPLAIEIEYVLKLWLTTPPAFVSGLCLILMVGDLCDRSTVGHAIAIHATGRIALYSSALSIFNLMALPLAWIFLSNGGNVYSAVFAMALTTACFAGGRLWFARKILSFGISHWIRSVALPIIISTFVAGIGGFAIRFLMEPSFVRLTLVTGISEGIFLLLIWLLAIEKDERCVVVSWLSKALIRSGYRKDSLREKSNG